MNICFIESEEHICKLDAHILDTCLPIALTPFAMCALDKLGVSYRIITDYANIEELDAMLYETVDKCMSFCRKIDKIIRAKFKDSIFEISEFEPCFWMNKYVVAFFFPTLTYTNIFKRIIEYEKPSRIYYFNPNDWKIEGEKINFSNTNFIAYHLNSIKDNFPKIEWITFSSGNEFLMPGFPAVANRRGLKRLLVKISRHPIKTGWLFLKRWKEFHAFRRIGKNSKGILILKTIKEIEEIIRNYNGKKQIWLWTNPDKMETAPVSCSLIPQKAELNIESSVPQVLFSDNEFSEVLKEIFPKFYKNIIRIILKKYPIIHKEIFESIQVYLKTFSRLSVLISSA